jgi:Hsp70 protein/DnaJ C terminal domain
MPASLNGCGTTYYGSRDFYEDGSYVTTEWIIFAHIPIFPLASFRVLPVDGGQNYLVFRSQKFRSQKIPLCHQQVRNTYLTLLTVILAIVLIFLLASVNGRLALIYIVFLLSVFPLRKIYLRWYQNIVRMIRSRNQFNQHSAKQQASNIRKDLDLTLKLALSPEEMCNGTRKQVSTEDSIIDVSVPAGISPGKHLRIRGKGRLEHETSERGDLYLEIVAKTDSFDHSNSEKQWAEPEKSRNRVLKVGEGTSSVIGIVLDDESLSVGIVQNGYTTIIPNQEGSYKASALCAWAENGDGCIDQEAVAQDFRQLVAVASSYLNFECSDIVVAVPCWFSMLQRNALKNAAAIANLRLICCYNSSSLASIACKLRSSINQTIIVFEISRNSLSTAILSVGDGVFEVLGTYGEKLNSHRVDDLCRISLKKLLDDTQLTKNQIDEVILLGDSSNALTARQVILNTLDRDPIQNPLAGTEVVLGASIRAGILSKVVEGILLLDVIPWSLGIETQGNALGAKAQGGMMTKIVSRNVTIPTRKTAVFSTAVDAQTEVVIHVLQGEKSKTEDNLSLRIFRLDGISPAPRGVPEIEVEFAIDVNARLSVRAKDKRSDKELYVVLD